MNAAGDTPTELGQRACKTAEHALLALQRIEALLDEDCDETRVRLYNPNSTVAAIRRALEQATADINAVESATAPAADVNTESRLLELELNVRHLLRPIEDRDAIAWEIGRSAGIRGDALSLNPFRVQR